MEIFPSDPAVNAVGVLVSLVPLAVAEPGWAVGSLGFEALEVNDRYTVAPGTGLPPESTAVRTTVTLAPGCSLPWAAIGLDRTRSWPRRPTPARSSPPAEPVMSPARPRFPAPPAVLPPNAFATFSFVRRPSLSAKCGKTVAVGRLSLVVGGRFTPFAGAPAAHEHRRPGRQPTEQRGPHPDDAQRVEVKGDGSGRQEADQGDGHRRPQEAEVTGAQQDSVELEGHRRQRKRRPRQGDGDGRLVLDLTVPAEHRR